MGRGYYYTICVLLALGTLAWGQEQPRRTYQYSYSSRTSSDGTTGGSMSSGVRGDSGATRIITSGSDLGGSTGDSGSRRVISETSSRRVISGGGTSGGSTGGTGSSGSSSSTRWTSSSSGGTTGGSTGRWTSTSSRETSGSQPSSSSIRWTSSSSSDRDTSGSQPSATSGTSSTRWTSSSTSRGTGGSQPSGTSGTSSSRWTSSSSSSRGTGGSQPSGSSGSSSGRWTSSSSSRTPDRTTTTSDSSRNMLLELQQLLRAELDEFRHEMRATFDFQERSVSLLTRLEEDIQHLSDGCCSANRQGGQASVTAQQLDMWWNRVDERLHREQSSCILIQNDVRTLEQKVDYVTQLFARYHASDAEDYANAGMGGAQTGGRHQSGSSSSSHHSSSSSSGGSQTGGGGHHSSSSSGRYGSSTGGAGGGGGGGSYFYSRNRTYTSGGGGGAGGGSRYTGSTGGAGGGGAGGGSYYYSRNRTYTSGNTAGTGGGGSSGGSRHTGSSGSSGSRYSSSNTGSSSGNTGGGSYHYSRNRTYTSSNTGGSAGGGSSHHSSTAGAGGGSSSGRGSSQHSSSHTGGAGGMSSSSHRHSSSSGSSSSGTQSQYAGSYYDPDLGQYVYRGRDETPNMTREGVDYSWRYENSDFSGARQPSEVNRESHGTGSTSSREGSSSSSHSSRGSQMGSSSSHRSSSTSGGSHSSSSHHSSSSGGRGSSSGSAGMHHSGNRETASGTQGSAAGGTSHSSTYHASTGRGTEYGDRRDGDRNRHTSTYYYSSRGGGAGDRGEDTGSQGTGARHSSSSASSSSSGSRRTSGSSGQSGWTSSSRRESSRGSSSGGTGSSSSSWHSSSGGSSRGGGTRVTSDGDRTHNEYQYTSGSSNQPGSYKYVKSSSRIGVGPGSQETTSSQSYHRSSSRREQHREGARSGRVSYRGEPSQSDASVESALDETPVVAEENTGPLGEHGAQGEQLPTTAKHRHHRSHRKHQDKQSNEVTFDASSFFRTSSFVPDPTYGVCPAYVNGIVEEHESVRSDVATVMGTWMRDTGARSDKLWSVEGSNAMHWKNLVEYDTLADYKERLNSRYHTLSESCTGLGPVIYKNYLYCQAYAHRRKAVQVLKFDLETDQVVARGTVASLQGLRGGVPYRGWAGIYLHAQILVDETGMWVLTGESNTRRLTIHSIDPESLQVIDTMRTSQTKDAVGPAFMSCGILYALDSHYAMSLTYMYNTKTGLDMELSGEDMPFPHMDLASIQYSPYDNTLYVWRVTREEVEARPGRPARARVYGISELVSLQRHAQSKFDFF